MRNFPAIATTSLPPISQIDCLPQNRVDPDEFEQKRRAEKIDEHKKQTMSQTAALKQQTYSRKRTQYPSGILPPISQISMGGRQLPADNREDGLKLPPISQVSCLGGYVDEKKIVVKQSKSRIRDTDTDFIRLSKQGGQKNLLHYMEANSTSRADATDAPAYPRSTQLNAGFTSEADPRWRPSQWSDFTRRGKPRVGDHGLVWR